MISVSVSDVESFRRYRDDEDFPLEVLLRQLQRVDEQTPAMKAGEALHKILERAEIGEMDEAEADGFRFRFAFDGELSLSPVREMRGRRTWTIGGHEIELRARVDAFDGYMVEDHKLTGHTFDATNYADSYQWRLYLAIFNAMAFRYNVFVGSPSKNDETLIEIKEFHPFRLYRYPGLEDDVTRLLGQFVDFAVAHLEVAA